MSALPPISYEHELLIQTTQDVLGTLVGMRSAWIYAEEHSPKPDQAKIDAWVREQGDYGHLRNRLPLMDQAQVADLLNTYDAQVESEGGVEIAPHKVVRSAEVNTAARDWANANIKNDQSRDTFMQHVDKFTKEMAQPARQKQLNVPSIQKNSPDGEKAR